MIQHSSLKNTWCTDHVIKFLERDREYFLFPEMTKPLSHASEVHQQEHTAVRAKPSHLHLSDTSYLHLPATHLQRFVFRSHTCRRSCSHSCCSIGLLLDGLCCHSKDFLRKRSIAKERQRRHVSTNTRDGVRSLGF